jgi:hypothetical protein
MKNAMDKASQPGLAKYFSDAAEAARCSLTEYRIIIKKEMKVSELITQREQVHIYLVLLAIGVVGRR